MHSVSVERRCARVLDGVAHRASTTERIEERRVIPILWLCGPPGVGKTAVAWEIYERLGRAGSAPAFVDVDQLGMCDPPPAGDPERHILKARNVAALRANFSDAGARGLVVSGVVDATRELDVDVLGGPTITVCRLRADRAELGVRLGRRHASFAGPGIAQEADAFEHSAFAEWSVDTTKLTVDEVASRVLTELGDWPVTGADRGDSSPTVHDLSVDARGEVLWLCGTTGVGKSTVGFRVYVNVLSSGVPAAYVDVDQVGFCSTAPSDDRVRARNLAALWRNFRHAGARVAVVVGPVATRSEAAFFERALAPATFTWCRLHAGGEELTRRILSRGAGGSWSQPGDPLRDRPGEELLDVARRAIADSQILERHDLGLRIDLEGLSVDEAADRVVELTAWPGSGRASR
jgi:adenylylsulfate kinase-like enzyme